MKEPLAFRLRPDRLDDVLGQQHLTGENMILRRCVDQQRLFSMIFYGPPGCGKTTLAIALANELNVPYRLFNAVTSNKKDLTDLFEEARLLPGLIIIIDEIHTYFISCAESIVNGNLCCRLLVNFAVDHHFVCNIL